MIVAIVVASIALIAIAWCIIGCLCCGYTCCKGCCSCCCPSRSKGGGDGKRSKFADDPSRFQPHHQPPPSNFGYQPNPAPPTYGDNAQTSYAQFDVPTSRPSPGPGMRGPGQKLNEDALPAMPTWNDARNRHVEDTSPQPHAMEMDRLDPTTGQTVGTISKSGYHEVPSQPSSPGFAPEAYRGTETTHGPLGPTPIGVAHSSDYNDYPHRRPSPSPYMDSGAYSHAYSRPSPSSSPGPGSGGRPGMFAADTHAYQPPVPAGMPVSPRSPTHYTAGSPPPSAAPPSYRTYSPGPAPISSPPPSFHTHPGPQEQQQPQAARPPSLLQAGRKPVENSWRDV